jgi:phage tail sheath protein FI
MPEYLAPGVYIEEVESGPKPIEGVSTSTAGMVGMTVRGPVDGLPQLVTSFADFRRRFGGYLPEAFGNSRFLAHAVRGFFENGGRRVYIKRVYNSGNPVDPGIADATPAPAAAATLLTRLTHDVQSGDVSATLGTLRGISAGTVLNLTMVKDGLITGPHPVTVTNYDAANNRVDWAAGDAPADTFEYRYTTVAVTLAGGPFTTPVTVAAADPGRWGNNIAVQIFHTSRAQAQVLSLSADPVTPAVFDIVELTTTNNFYVGAIVEFDRGAAAGAPADKEYARVRAIVGNSLLIDRDVDFAAATDLDPQPPATVTAARTCEFRIAATYEAISESFGPLTLDNATPFFYEAVVNNRSNLIRVSGGPLAENHPFSQPSGTDGLNLILTGGIDGIAPTEAEYRGVDNGPGLRSGLQALIDIDEISIIAIPGITSQDVQNAMITHCETLLDRFAVFDPEYNPNTALDDIQNQRRRYDTKYAALYFPNLLSIDPVSGQEIVLPPSGHVVGLYAKTDVERGVHKAPANVVVQGIIGVEVVINKGEQDILNPDNINVIRDFRASNRGIRVWGSRCLTSDTQWKYVPVRRLFIFVEESLDEGTQWVVFEPNDYPLWARVRQSITNFLVRVWRDGALMGATQEEAFFVRCDRTTMTQDDIDNGRLIVLVGIAPVKPAEFVIIRISQYTAEANVSG